MTVRITAGEWQLQDQSPGLPSGTLGGGGGGVHSVLRKLGYLWGVDATKQQGSHSSLSSPLSQKVGRLHFYVSCV